MSDSFDIKLKKLNANNNEKNGVESSKNNSPDFLMKGKINSSSSGADVERLEQEYSAAQQECDKASQEHEKEQSDIQNQITSFQTEKGGFESDISAKEGIIQTLNSQIQSIGNPQAPNQSDYAVVTEEGEGDDKKTVTSYPGYAEALAEYQSKMAQLQQLRSQLQQAQNEKNTLQNKINNLDIKISGLNSKNSQSSTEVQQAQTKVNSAKSKLDAAKIQQQQAQMNAINEQNNSLTNQNNSEKNITYDINQNNLSENSNKEITKDEITKQLDILTAFNQNNLNIDINSISNKLLKQNAIGEIKDLKEKAESKLLELQSNSNQNTKKLLIGFSADFLEKIKTLENEINKEHISEEQEEVKEEECLTDPIGIEKDGVTYDFIKYDGDFDSINDFLGSSDAGIGELIALDGDKSGTVSGDELADSGIMVVRTDADGNQTLVPISEVEAELGGKLSINLAGINTDSKEDQNFDVNIEKTDGTVEKYNGYSTYKDNQYFQDNYDFLIDGIKELEDNLSQWMEFDKSELYDPKSPLNELFKIQYGYDIVSYYNNLSYGNNDIANIQGFVYQYSQHYPKLLLIQQNLAAANAYAFSNGIDVQSDFVGLLSEVPTSGDILGTFGLYVEEFSRVANARIGELLGNKEYSEQNFCDYIYDNGDISVEIDIKDDKTDHIDTVFDGQTTKIKYQVQYHYDGTKTVIEYDQDGSGKYTVTYPDGTKKSSEEISLEKLNAMGEDLETDITGNNDLSQRLVHVQSADEAYNVITAYCGGDKETARKIFNVLYQNNNISIDESYNINKNEEKTNEYIENPLYHKDQTEVTKRLYTLRAQDRVLNSDILKQFSSSNENTVIIDGYDTEIPDGGHEYYIDSSGQLCRNDYTVTFNENSNLSVTSTITNSDDNSVLYTETVDYYTDESGQVYATIVRKDAYGEEIANITETADQYNKRILVERNYAKDVDNDGLPTLDLDSNEINQLYSLMIQDSRYAGIINQFGNELNSHGIFDKIHDFFLDLFGEVNSTKLANEIVGRTSMVPAIEDFVSGDEETALKATEEEFNRRMKTASSIQEIYDIAYNYYNDEETAYNYVSEYVKNNYSSFYTESSYISPTGAKLVKKEDGSYTIEVSTKWSARGYSGTGTKYFDFSTKISGFDVSKVDKSSFVSENAQTPNDFNSLYKFWTNGGEYTDETIAAYQQASTNYSQYNTAILSAASTETELSNANTPKEVFEIFLKHSKNKDEAIEKFNNYYNNIFSYTGEIPCNPDFSESYMITSVKAVKNNDGNIAYEITIKNSYGQEEKYSSPEEAEIYLSLINGYVENNQVLQRQTALQYYNSYYGDDEIPEDEDAYKYITEKINNEFFTAQEKLYGDSELQDILQGYCNEMDSYAQRLTQIVQLGSIGLSFICPAFGYVAMAAGFIDNTIDLGNMLSNNQYDDYSDWIKNTGIEAFCTIGGMALGSLCNRVGGRVTESLLRSRGASYAVQAQIAGTSVEVVLDVVSGMAFDYATNAIFYGQTDWNLSGNMFSGLLDIISGIRGYHARNKSLDIANAKPNSDYSSVKVPNGFGEDVEFKCVGVDNNGRLIYSDGQGRILKFDSSVDSSIKPMQATQAAILADDLTSNPILAQKLINEGIQYNPASGKYLDANGREVVFEKTTDRNGTSIIKQSGIDANGQPYNKIMPSSYVIQGADNNCGALSVINRALSTTHGVDELYSAIREYPDGHLEVRTADGSYVRLNATLDDGLSAVYKEAMPFAMADEGSFADETASALGLNPVRVAPDANGEIANLNELANIADEGFLAVGVRYPDGTGHYMTVKDINAETGKITVVDPADGTTKVIDLNAENPEFKVEEIAGGSTNVSQPDMYTARPDDVKPYGARKGKSTSNVDYLDTTKVDATSYNAELRHILEAKYGEMTDDDFLRITTDEKFRQTYGDGIDDIAYKRAQYDAFMAVADAENIVEVGGRKVFLTPDQRADFEARQNLPLDVNSPRMESYCQQVLKSDAMLVEAMAVNCNIDIKGKTNAQLFIELKRLYEQGIDVLPGITKPDKEGYLFSFFYRNSISDPITETVISGKGGDKIVHELCDSMDGLYSENTDFQNKWIKYCTTDNPTFKSYSDLADTYHNELRQQIINSGIPESQVDALIENSFGENLDHIIFRAMQRDGLVSPDSMVADWTVSNDTMDVSTLMSELADIVINKKTGTQTIMGMQLTYEYDANAQRYIFGTLEYDIPDWASQAPYIPHF